MPQGAWTCAPGHLCHMPGMFLPCPKWGSVYSTPSACPQHTAASWPTDGAGQASMVNTVGSDGLGLPLPGSEPGAREDRREHEGGQVHACFLSNTPFPSKSREREKGGGREEKGPVVTIQKILFLSNYFLTLVF